MELIRNKNEWIVELKNQLKDCKDEDILQLAIHHFFSFIGANFAGIQSKLKNFLIVGGAMLTGTNTKSKWAWAI